MTERAGTDAPEEQERAASVQEPPVPRTDGVHAPEEDEVLDAEAAPAQEPPAAEEEPDFKDRWMRSVAELDNVRKRARRDVSVAESRGIARLAKELLPALDNLERALAAAEAQPENQDHHLTDGIRLVQSELLGALARVGIEPDSPKGEQFDPHRHEALAQQPVEGAEPGTIVEVYSAGYRIRAGAADEMLLRPARVVVAS
jgi:molecular chaperone GrpE